MLNLKSWRWSRLFEASGLKRIITHWNLIFIILFLSAFGLYICYRADETHKLLNMEIITYVCAISLLFAILMTICTSDNYYEIKSDSKKIKIFLYNSGLYFYKPIVTMVIKTKDYITKEDIAPDFYFYQYDNSGTFLFYSIKNKIWYNVSPTNDTQILGQKIGDTVFKIPDNDHKLIILDDRGTSVIEADAYFFNGIYIPPIASQNIFDAITGDKVTEPEDFLISKRGDRYIVYGLYHKTTPQYRELKIPTVIFREGFQDVILLWDDNTETYREFYRTHYSAKRKLNDVFIEMSYKNGIGGTVKKFNEQTKSLDLLYKGYFYAIDFDKGHIIGEKGYTYPA